MTPGRRVRRGIALAVVALAALGMAACAGTPAGGGADAAAPAKGAPAASAAAAVEATALPLVNPGFEADPVAGSANVSGWVATQHAGDRSYLFTVDATTKHGGARSLRIDNVGVEPYGAVMQVVDARAVAGRKVRFSAWLATRDASGDGASLMIVAEGSRILAHDAMAGAELKGTRGWARQSVEIALPPATTQLRVGIVLQGKGTLWVDDAALEIVDAP
jgi:hypothetical protein